MQDNTSYHGFSKKSCVSSGWLVYGFPLLAKSLIDNTTFCHRDVPQVVDLRATKKLHSDSKPHEFTYHVPGSPKTYICDPFGLALNGEVLGEMTAQNEEETFGDEGVQV